MIRHWPKVVLYGLGLTILASLPSFAEQKAKGFFYDSAGDRYFSDGKSSFSIRPIRDKNYVERIEVSIDEGAFQPYNGRLQFNTEGLHNIRFRAVDPVHNWSPIQHFRVFVDMNPPKSRPFWQGSQYQKDGIFYVAPGSQLLINSQDTLSGVNRVVWKRKDKVTTFPGKLNFKIPGQHKIQFASVDNVGNAEAWYEVIFFVDGKAPRSTHQVQGTSFKSKENLFVSSGSEINIVAQDDKAGVKTIEYRINGGPITEYQHPIAISDNKFNLKYRSIDQVGNKEDWRAFTVYQDSTPPRLKLAKVGSHRSIAGKLFAKPGFGFKATASDDESGLKEFLVSLDGKNFQTAKSNQWAFKKPGTYFFEVNAKDKVGNLNASNPYTVVIDNVPPSSELTATDELVEKNGVYLSAIPNRLKITANDEGVGIERIEISYDGKKFKRFKDEIDLSVWKNSRQTLYYRAVDRLGNVEKANKVTVLVRKSAPAVELYVENANQPEIPLSSLKSKTRRTPAKAGSSRGSTKKVIKKKSKKKTKKKTSKKKRAGKKKGKR